MNVLVIGASRGIGLELVRQYAQDGARVVATARDEAGLERVKQAGATKALALDVADPVSASGLAWPLDGEQFDVVVHNAGVFGPRLNAPHAPTQADFDAVMHANVLGAMWVLPQLVDHFAQDARVGVLSSRMGSIGLRARDSGYGNGWLYRASKAALNSVLTDLASGWAGRAICVALHPGWVRTDMGGAGADLDVAESASGLRSVLAGLKANDNGKFFNVDGSTLSW